MRLTRSTRPLLLVALVWAGIMVWQFGKLRPAPATSDAPNADGAQQPPPPPPAPPAAELANHPPVPPMPVGGAAGSRQRKQVFIFLKNKMIMVCMVTVSSCMS